jgi:hypothetical protein
MQRIVTKVKKSRAKVAFHPVLHKCNKIKLESRNSQTKTIMLTECYHILERRIQMPSINKVDDIISHDSSSSFVTSM